MLQEPLGRSSQHCSYCLPAIIIYLSQKLTLSLFLSYCSYLAPEYFMYGKVNDKVDVYAYGVVLLELLSGRKPISNDFPNGQESLVMWVCLLSFALCKYQL